MSIDPGYALQVAAVAALLASTDLTGMVATTKDGPAVFAPGQRFSDALPRVTIEPTQVLDRSTGCVAGSECFVTVHYWAGGDDGSLVAARLAGAGRVALDTDIAPNGHRIIAGKNFEGTRSAGDPDETITHLVSTFRYLTEPA